MGIAFAIAALVSSCGDDATIQVPNPTVYEPATSSDREDPIAECQSVSDGTACGEPGRDMHCVFGACQKNVCGDFVQAGREGCDDGNDVGGDGCDRYCRPETCGNARVDAGEDCDDGNRDDDDGCSNVCTTFVCGNGRVDPGEECDDGNEVEDDRCSNRCTRNICRNGRLDPGEECDDGNRVHDDFCSNACTRNVCGNLRVDPGEECDDGNDVDTDACSNACTLNVCGNRRRDPGEVCDGDTRETGGLRQVCRADCAGYEDDSCSVCVEEKCSPWATVDIDVFSGCRVSVDPSVTSPMSGFIEKCSALDDCVRSTGCYDPDFYMLPCMCGDLDNNACRELTNPDDLPGACREEIIEATGCARNVLCLYENLGDATKPSGWANFLAQCRREECASECGL